MSDIEEIFNVAIKAVMPSTIIENSAYLKTLTHYKIHLFGSGKASVEMAKAMEKLFGDNIVDGFVVAPYGDDSLKRVEVFESSHPIPSQKSLDAAKIMIEKFRALKEDDLFIYLLSGGSSALIELPQSGVSLEDLIKTTNLLLQNGVPIDEVNIIRKHLSQIKGGRLAKNTKVKGIVLVISDVVGDALEAIGSAPLYFDSSTCEDAKQILNQYGLSDKIPFGCFESPKEPAENIEHLIIASNKIALQSAKEHALKLGYLCEIVTDSLQGDVKIVADEIVKTVQKRDAEVFLFGGECTVDVVGEGKGGRNQELCLHVLKQIREHENITFLSAGSDGIDGNSVATGGVVDSQSYREDIDDFLKNNDSYHYLKRGNNLLITGPTGTNVMDIMIAIKGAKHV